MTVRVADDIIEFLREGRDEFTVQVRAGDVEAARRGVEASLDEIAQLTPDWADAPAGRRHPEEARPVLDPVVPATTGPVVGGDIGGLPQALRLQIPRIIARHVAQAGVDEAVVALPERSPFAGDPLTGAPPPVDLSGPDRAVVLLALLPPPLRTALPATRGMAHAYRRLGYRGLDQQQDGGG